MTLVFLLLLAIPIFTVADPSGFEKKLRDEIQPILDIYAQQFNTSFVVGIANADGSFEIAAGSDDHEGKLVTENTLIPMGSATKLYTATAVMQLAEKGIVDIDKPVYEIVDPFLTRTNGTTLLQLWNGDERVNRITSRQLMGMRSCLSDYDDQKLTAFSLDPANANVTIDPYDYLHVWAPKNFVCEPGEGGAYSSIGYVILGLVVASATNATSWTDVDQRFILTGDLSRDLDEFTFPLIGPCSSYENVSHQYAALFSQREAPGYWTTIDWEDLYDMSCLNGWTMGNLAAAPSNTASAVYHIFGANASPSLVSEASLKEMMVFQPLTVGWSVGLMYGLGVMETTNFYGDGVDKKYTTFVGHAGQDFGSAAPLHHYNSATDIAITLATNSEFGMNCSLPNILSNFQDSGSLSCHIWDAVLQIVTNGTIGRLSCGSGVDDNIQGRRLWKTYGQTLPAHCSSASCDGASSSIESDECLAWKKVHARANGATWPVCSDKWSDPCGCERVRCSDDGTHILEIDLSFMGITGQIAPEIDSFSELRSLNVSFNYFFGDVPSSLSSVPKLTLLDVHSNLFSGDLPALPFSQYTDGCDVGMCDFSCPMPVGATACHASSKSTTPTCDSGPSGISTPCMLSSIKIQSDPSYQSVLASLTSAIGQRGQQIGTACGTQLEKNRTCHLNIDIYDDTIGPLVNALANATRAVESDARICAINLDKKQTCDNIGPCEIVIGNVTVQGVSSHCNEDDANKFLSWTGRLSQCIKDNYGTSCVYSWASGGGIAGSCFS